ACRSPWLAACWQARRASGSSSGRVLRVQRAVAGISREVPPAADSRGDRSNRQPNVRLRPVRIMARGASKSRALTELAGQKRAGRHIMDKLSPAYKAFHGAECLLCGRFDPFVRIVSQIRQQPGHRQANQTEAKQLVIRK